MIALASKIIYKPDLTRLSFFASSSRLSAHWLTVFTSSTISGQIRFFPASWWAGE
jgi:hypothetical protein